ncbi:MAG: aldehyde ferredoxin oxidoreductase family protein [Spirochaetes bacterium]|nr:aldehyde ferredoxin oxidoreductase family protein [Spirochaetota bacterium]
MKGYRGTILRIDLSAGSVRKTPLSEEFAHRWIGGKGFGGYLNYRENRPETNALSPENRLIFACGPGAGTILPTATRIGLFSKSPLNDRCIDSYVGGSVGHFLKKAGYDILILEGRAAVPSYIEIVDDRVSIKNAEDLWGKDTYETEDLLKERLGTNARVLSIGKAGENLVRYACIGNDYHRHFGRMGSGAVMGSKLLKAIAVIGTGDVEVYDPDGLKRYVRDLNRRIRENPSTGGVYPKAGTPSFVKAGNELGVFPSHYWHRGRAKHWERLTFEYMRDNTLVKQTRCYGCTIGCAHINRIDDGPYAGIEIDGPEYETIYAFGGLCDVGDIREVIKLNDVCDRLGIDTISTGNVLGLLMDATGQGRIPDEYRVRFGDTERMLDCIERIAKREESWQIMGEGIRRIAKRFGLGDIAIHVKGLEPAGFDPRGLQSMAVTYGVGNRGASHLTSNAYARDIGGRARDHELSGDDKSVDRFSLERKAELVYNMINFNAIADCIIVCRFLNRDLLTWEDYSEMLHLLTGIKKGRDELCRDANDIVSVNRLWNIEGGLTKKDDLLPGRFYDEAVESGGAVVSREEYERQLRAYYSLRNWDEEGVPFENPAGLAAT